MLVQDDIYVLGEMKKTVKWLYRLGKRVEKAYIVDDLDFCVFILNGLARPSETRIEGYCTYS